MSKKIILRQSVKSGVAVVFFFGLGMASINAQTTQTTQPTGKVGINTTEPTETLDVKGKVRIQELYTDNQQTGTNNATFTATNVVTVDNNGVLGKKTLSSITAAQTPNLPWKKVGTENDNAVPADGLKMYSKYAVGIGDYYAKKSIMESLFEINGGGSSQLGLINGTNKWDISTENKALTFTKRKPDNGRIFSVTQDAKLFLGNNLLSEDGSNAKVILDGGNGKIGIGKNSAEYNLDVAGNTGIKGQLNLIDSSNDNNKFLTYTEGTQLLFDKKIAVPILHTTQTGVMASLTNVGKLYLGNNLTKPDGETLYTKNAKILLDGENGTVGIGKNYTDYDLDVNGYTRISQLPTSNDYAKYYTTENGTRVQKTKTEKYAPKKMVVVDDNGVLGKADIPTGGGSGNGVTKHTGNSTPQCNAANAGTIHYKEEVTVNGKSTSVMGFCMKTATKQYRWFYIFGGAGTTTGSEAATPNFGDGL